MTNQALRECLLPKSNEEEESLVKNLSYKKRKNSNDKSLSIDSDFFQEAFGIGKATELLFEEITDEQDQFEAFFTTMFIIGIFFIPFVLIFSDYIKPYDLQIIINIQKSSIYSEELFVEISKILKLFYSLKVHMSVTIFIYLAIDPGIGFKVALTAGMTYLITFFLNAIIHDERPYWISSEVKPSLCYYTFGCPSVNLLSGFLYYNLLNFNIDRALKAKDPFLEKNKSALKIGNFIAKFYIIVNVIIGIQLFCNGENFLYQILSTFLIGFIIVRILFAFNKELDYYVNGARYIQGISNVTSIWVFIFIITCACSSWIFYSSISEDLVLSKDNFININVSLNN